jgi:arsenate reductase-like glutaredoxin family protein
MPDTIVVSLIGLFGVFIGILASSIINRKSISAQNAHDSQEREKERAYELKKNVFINAGEGIQMMSQLIGTITNESLDLKNISQEFGHAASLVGKSSIAASERTMEATSDYLTKASEFFMLFLIKRMSLDELVIERDILVQDIQKKLNEQSGYLEQMKQYNLSGSNDKPQYERIKRIFQLTTEELEKLSSSRDHTQRELEICQTKLVTELSKEMEMLASISARAVARMRIELGLPINENAFIETARNSSARIKSALHVFLDDLKSNGSQQPPE